MRGGQPLRIALGIIALALLLAGTAIPTYAMTVGDPVPTSPVTSVAGVPQTFTVCVIDEPVYVDWKINGILVKHEEGITCTSYTNSDATAGTWSVDAYITGTSPVVVHWTWTVEPTVPIPEFPTIALPIVAVVGLVFFFHKRKK